MDADTGPDSAAARRHLDAIADLLHASGPWRHFGHVDGSVANVPASLAHLAIERAERLAQGTGPSGWTPVAEDVITVDLWLHVVPHPERARAWLGLTYRLGRQVAAICRTFRAVPNVRDDVELARLSDRYRFTAEAAGDGGAPEPRIKRWMGRRDLDLVVLSEAATRRTLFGTPTVGVET